MATCSKRTAAFQITLSDLVRQKGTPVKDRGAVQDLAPIASYLQIWSNGGPALCVPVRQTVLET